VFFESMFSSARLRVVSGSAAGARLSKFRALRRFRALQSRDRKRAVGPPTAAQGGKAVAQVPDSRRDHSEEGFDTAC
jgi:hypothetical protein